MPDAKIKLTAAVVESVNSTGSGFTVSVPYDFKGETRKSYYKVWADTKVTVGATVDIVGQPSARLSEYTNKISGELKTTAELNINNAIVTVSEPAF